MPFPRSVGVLTAAILITGCTGLTSADSPEQVLARIRVPDGFDVSIFATGHLVWHAVEAARQLKKEGISVDLINIHTIKPLDEEAVLASARKTGAVVTAEEHNRYGGLGDAVSQVLVREQPTPQDYVAVNDTFGESGPAAALLDKYGLGVEDVVKAAKKALRRKK